MSLALGTSYLPPPKKRMNLGSDAQGATCDCNRRKAMIGRVATQFPASLAVQGKLGAATKAGTVTNRINEWHLGVPAADRRALTPRVSKQERCARCPREG